MRSRASLAIGAGPPWTMSKNRRRGWAQQKASVIASSQAALAIVSKPHIHRFARCRDSHRATSARRLCRGQLIDLRQRLVTPSNRRVALGERRRDQRLQRFDVGRKLGDGLAHARHSIRFASSCGMRRAAGSLRRSAHDLAAVRIAGRQMRQIDPVDQRGELR
jgi:hypothetical protein